MSTSYSPTDLPAGDFEKITVSTSAIGFTASKILINQANGFKKRAVRAYCTVESNTIRYRTDGTDPDANTGHSVAAGGSFTVEGEDNVRRLKMIRASADATVQVTYYYNR